MPSKWDRIISALVTWIKNIPRESEVKQGRYELIQAACAEIILSHFENIWWCFSHTFHHFVDELSWKYKKTCQSGTWILIPFDWKVVWYNGPLKTHLTLIMYVITTSFAYDWQLTPHICEMDKCTHWCHLRRKHRVHTGHNGMHVIYVVRA